MGEPVASLRASPSADGRPQERAPCTSHRNLALLLLEQVALLPGCSCWLLLPPWALESPCLHLRPCSVSRTIGLCSAAASGEGGRVRIIRGGSWITQCGVCSSSHTANRKGSFHKCCSFGLSAGVISEKLSPTVVSSPTFGLD